MSAEVKSRIDEWNLSQQAIPLLYDQIAAALAKAQADMQNPGFDSTNPHFKNKFASLAAVRNAVVPVFAKHGIAVSQDLASVEGAVSCKTILTHSSGQQMVFGPLVLPVSKNDAQGFGSAATYARRYHLMAVACVVGDDDDDANAATGKPATAIKAEAKPVPEDVWIALTDAAAQGEPALRSAWKGISEATRNAITTAHSTRWESLKSISLSPKVAA